ncbi:protein-associating with the carboxyl-terminal domain of ezrin-like [Amphibalanus amphitrite]|uniref:protein-associating with the carboxyl-terminal domain of ezrin-like n=1 Tax=Amphibalanus amphitrite TaxID=1232801 RepID=UPI001C9114DF|nr:protein-associating with the carboxyl-terminal domain of ezrin-like [Amphibalanus amphitrite]XP_043231571.1 protein-associating with the carboxyl-terminal domain of ezrin-like [Amphibalanus amphitrite]XP_043231572.1 protein-associating with the carboxyl-terminal domain of ezrin-like [Amphibalanus amphitrite]XP_043231573.1 protein-associating with the carboxyl-terminal domain of ezrin-like [Amphibalanus amphitrite]XP_043231574.1 protein-associating with the carboxyl-terminal domain of ezrin-l
MGNDVSISADYTVNKESFGTAAEWVLYEGRRNIPKAAGQHTEDEAAEVLDNISGNVVTVFVGMPGEKRGKTSTLHNNVQTLMTARHPDLLRFLSWRQTGSRLELVTEPVRPLAEVRPRLTELDVSGGLLAVLRALDFLHRQAGLCHNNVCEAAVFVTAAGGWRLGGAEFACPFSEATPERLQATAAHRYQPALAPEEAEPTAGASETWRQKRPWCRDVYAYGVLAEELIGPAVQNEFPGARQFRDEVKRRLLSRDPFARPSLDQLEGHDFFSNEFNQIHGFLENLVLKSQEERKTFFIDLASRLRAYPEELVASRLSSLCLSRLVLLDPDACRHFLPRLLSPRYDQYATGECVLSPTVFRRHIVPQLLRILHVHDAHIRLVLLQHFSKYVAEIPKHLLGDVVLPELLLGIRDTHDDLVAATLRALADLVPILGSQVVIGPHRHKHFGNGTPKASSGKGVTPARRKRVTLSQKATEAPPERRRTLLELSQAAAGESDSLPERRSPEGGEELGLEPDLGPAADAPSDPGSDSELGPGVESEDVEEDAGDWSDWEATDVDPDPPPIQEILVQPEDSGAVSAGFELSPTPLEAGPVPQTEAASGKTVTEVKGDSPAVEGSAAATAARASGGGGLKLSGRAPPPRRPQPQPASDDFERFSIQVRRKEPEAEVDLFADMQPVIRSGRPTLLAPEPAPAGPKTDPKPQPRHEVKPELEPEVVSSRLDMSFRPADGELTDAGWGDGDDWGDEF